MHVHLGLYGRFDVHRDAADGARRRSARSGCGWSGPTADDTAAYADLRGATACELLRRPSSATPWSPGSAPTRCGPTPTPTWPGSGSGAAGRRSRGLLMDQSVVAGIGNVYRAELLYRHRVDPFRPGRSLRAGQWQEMWDDLVELMADGVRTGRIDTVRPEHLTDEERDDRGPRRGHSYVYRRAGEPCRVCGTRVRTRVLQARNLYWCAKCQPRFRSRAVQ